MIGKNENGFHLVPVLLILVVIGAIGFVGYQVMARQKKANAEVRWSFDEKKNEWYVKEGKAPACKEPLKFDYTPIDISRATSVGFAGTYRGFNYKVHGGFGFAEDFNGTQDVRLPMDATLSGLVRYYEGDPPDLQYHVSFENDCGIMFYFDHLYTLSPQLQALAEQTPEPRLDDTSSSPADAPPRIKLKAGDIIATATGQPKVNRAGFDFGVVDYRKRNEISKNTEWARLHSEFESSEWYGVCWFNMLPGADAEKAKELSRVQGDTRRVAKHVSDYCDNADYSTLDFNKGQPAQNY